MLTLIMHWISTMVAFTEQGGAVLWGLFFLTWVLWSCIVERFIILHRYKDDTLFQPINDLDHKHDLQWVMEKCTEARMSQRRQVLFSGLTTIKILIALCPLLGLLGTVTGMIAVFDTLSITGTHDANAMAAGIYKATIPTMSGLFVALSALYCHFYLHNKAKRLLDKYPAKPLIQAVG